MACDVTSFRLRFPEFESNVEYPDARIQLFLDDAFEDIGPDELRWGEKFDRAHCYLSAHLLTSGTTTEAGNTSSNAGAITSKSAGGVSVTRSSLAKDLSIGDDFYLTTSYGQQFMRIRNSCFVGVMSTC